MERRKKNGKKEEKWKEGRKVKRDLKQMQKNLVIVNMQMVLNSRKLHTE